MFRKNNVNNEENKVNEYNSNSNVKEKKSLIMICKKYERKIPNKYKYTLKKLY